MTKLYLVRHGETEWNSQIRIQGHRDLPLSEIGRQQGRALGRRLAALAFDAAYASDLQRAAETARLILAGRNLPLALDEGLREANFGRWEGMTYAEVTAAFPEEQAARRERPAEVAPLGGETLPATLRRVQAVIDEIARTHPEQTVLVVTHGGPIRILLGGLLGLGLESYWKLRVDNCSLSIVDIYPEGSILSLLNDTCHLFDHPEGGDVP